MLTTTHPDATAFTARFLANPEDRLGRLVFADWLDEQGGPSNTPWAEYIRIQAELETRPWNDPKLGELCQRAVAVGREVRAKLTTTVAQPRVLTALPKLLPPHRCLLRTDYLPTDWDAVDAVPESVAVAHHLIPLHVEPWTIYLAARQPADDALRQRLQFILKKNVHLFGTDGLERTAEVLWHYHSTRPFRPIVNGEMWVDLDVPTADASAELNSVLIEMVEGGVVDVSFHGVPGYVLMAYQTVGGWRQRRPLSYDQFGTIIHALRIVCGGVVRRFPEILEFRHAIGNQVFHARGYLATNDPFPRLWFSLRPAPDR